MAGKHKSRQQRQSKTVRFQQRYGMDRQAFRDLKKSDPKKAHDLRMRPIKVIFKKLIYD